ncbi:ABC-F family ATP-binding cassette domain-containing protein [Herbivorax sp. ANBcel31]|uniref:ABC-F family ATP-binding cassette domain-containing protein n=1 Tax=Herbivorax sp. ANBcel31 TaxID=3069754 RepID=UPI0027AE56A5|nr:ABC-F family ATP-binding cassette domain-containing protein [Herbivorax sp. ANBcel31]MDQ2084899.1 ABC-F family ATP-binding cassette domain-containing protein [Herbivorax sp. ANBcel31]
MIILSCNDISFSFGINKILDNASFSIKNTDKVGIVGVNGAGKTTLFKIITSVYTAESGEIYTAKNLKLGYLEQDSGLNLNNTLLEEVLEVYSHFISMEARINQLEEFISTEKNEDALNSYMKEYSRLSEDFSRLGGFEYNSRAKGILKGLGFSEDEFHLEVDKLSGGQKTRLSLSKLLLKEPDLLLLDEPTNHLDINAIEWLEGFLKEYKKSVMVISHDRFFLDKITDKTLEIENCRVKLYNGNYSTYIKQKSADREVQQKHYEQQQKEISKMEAFIQQQKKWGRDKRVIAAESRQKALDKMEKIDRPESLPDKIKINFKSNIPSGNDVLFVENISKEFPEKPLFNNLTFNLKKGEKLFILGPNGCGKTTLLKILTENLKQTGGSFRYGHNVEMNYYDQEQESLNLDNTLVDEIWNANPNLSETEIRNALAMFLFKGEDVFKQISTLSGGEKSRISLIKIMLSGSNLLILDEPTNHLDINSRETLERSLVEFEDTLIVVSHDRYFINKLATRIIYLDNTSSNINYKGNYQDFLSYRDKINTFEQKKEDTDENLSSAKLQHLASKEEKSRKRRLEKLVLNTEEEISIVENRLNEINTQMQSEEIITDHVKLMDFQKEHDELNQKLEKLYETWEAALAES